MMKKILYLLLAMSLGVNAGLMATTLKHRGQPPHPPQQQPPGQPPGGGPGGHPGHAPDPQRMVEEHLAGMTRHLDLDPEQQASIRAILERDAHRLAELRQAVEAARHRMSDAFAAPDFDETTFLRLVAEAGAARAAVDSLSAVMLTSEAAVLTAEQRVLFAEVAPVIHANPGQAHQPRDPRHRPPPRR